MNVNDNHAEIMPGEMFLTNTDNENYNKISYKTKRMGNVAYTKDGRCVKGVFPVFVQEEEYEIARRKRFGNYK